jgi:hypothetical protein
VSFLRYNLHHNVNANESTESRRLIPIVNGNGSCIGIVVQANLALKDNQEKILKT